MELSENTKKICLFAIIGLVLVISLLAAFVPDFRTSAVTMVKGVLELVPIFAGK